MGSRRYFWGWTLVAMGALGLSAPAWPPLVAAWAQTRLGHQAGAGQLEQVARRVPSPVASPPTPAPLMAAPAQGRPVALLRIPALQLDATVVVGTTDTLLATAPGWVSTTALPGETGTAVIAAHNATFFRHINRLQAGSLIHVTTAEGRFTFRITGHAIVKTGTPVVNTVAPSLVLEACYPLNALYLTPWRYLVSSTLIASSLNPVQLPSSSTASGFSADVPSAVGRRWNLALSGNNLPMGSLTYTGTENSAVTAFQESPEPYALVEQSLRILFAVRDLAAAGDRATYIEMAPGLALPPFWGQRFHALGVTDVTIHMNSEGTPLGMTLTIHDVHWGNQATHHTVTLEIGIQGRGLHLQHIS